MSVSCISCHFVVYIQSNIPFICDRMQWNIIAIRNWVLWRWLVGISITGTAVGVVLVLPTRTNDSCSGVFPSTSLPSNFLSLMSVSDSDISEAFKLLWLSSLSVFMVYLHLWYSILSCLYLFWIYFKSILIPAAMAGSSNCSHLQKRQQCLSSYQTICIFNNFSKVFEFVMHDHISYYLNSKLNQNLQIPIC